MFDKLFTPITIRGMELKNRGIMPAMGTRFSGQDRYVTEKLIEYHRQRVRGGCPLNIVEVCSVHTPSAPKMFLSLSEDKYIPGMKELTNAIHEEGGKAGIQLWQGSLAVGMDPTAQMLMASDTPLAPNYTLPGISIEQIHEVVDCYGMAAKRAVEAGFDCLEFHCAHNYLPHSFLSGGINHRTDEYGGSFDNRVKFPLECIRAIRANMPDDMPLFMRIDAHDDYLEGGLTIEEVIEFCKLAKAEGVDVLDVSRGNIISAGNKYEVPPIDIPRGFNIENAARIRKETGMLTIGVGRINTPELAEKYLEEDKVDMVVLGRAQLVDSEFLNKAKAGNVDDIDYCVGCDQGCLDGFADVSFPHITCLRNPAVGRELECKIEKVETPKTVLIAGGGIAGLEAAIVLRQRGHNAIVCEASDKLGGQFITAGMAPGKAEMKDAVIAMGKKAERLGAEIRLNTRVDGDLVKEINPDVVINAIGAVPVIPNIPGVDKPFVVNSHDVLNGEVAVSGNVVIIGGGMVGLETAEYLAERGCKVTNLEMLKEYCADMGSARKICMMEKVYMLGIQVNTEVKVTAVEDGKVIGEKNGETVEYTCDYVVVAVGSRSRDGRQLEEAAKEIGVEYKVVGDALKARKALDATREAFDTALTI